MKKSYIRFDWAMKRLFRNKEYQIIEAFISVVLGKKVVIKNVFENGNRLEEIHDNDNRFDMVIEDEEGTQILVELQIHNEYAYFERYLFGTSNFLTKCINNEIKLDLIQKVNCINIITFPFYNNNDTVYHGKTEFRGIHNNELLSLSPFQQQKFEVSEVSELYPEYYILKVNDFDRWSKVPLEQWIYFLNTGEIPEEADAPGLKEAREKLKLDRMSKSELAAYYRHLDNVVILRDNIITARGEGHLEGKAEGRAEGRAEGIMEGIAREKLENARKMKNLHIPIETICQITGLPEEEIKKL